MEGPALLCRDDRARFTRHPRSPVLPHTCDLPRSSETYLCASSEPAHVHLCLFEDATVPHLYPLALTRAVGDLRVGARTLIETQLAAFADVQQIILWTRPEIADVTQQEHPDLLVNEMPAGDGGILLINQSWLVRSGGCLESIRVNAKLGQPNRAWKQGDTLIAAWLPDGPPSIEQAIAKALAGAEPVEDEIVISGLPDLIMDVAQRTAYDIETMGGLGKHQANIQTGALLAYSENIYIAEGAVIRPGAVLNAEDGPIHIARGASVDENAVIRGPVYVGEKSAIKAGARVAGSALGPGCKVGGEVHESIIHSYSNKPHDGYLGNSYIGRWCNLGADANTSNLKNDYGKVSVYDAVAGDFLPSGRQFAGLFMGDHSKCAINTMFNTGTVVGVFCNLFGNGFPPRHIPSFSWGSADIVYKLDKALNVAETVMARRGTVLSEADRAMLARLAGSM